jgi:phosphatidylglycerophosphate synthase
MNSKIPVECENPFDVILYKFADYISPYAKYLGFTPNAVTSLSNIFGMITVILLLKSYYILAILTFILSYFLDCLDGHMARKYKMYSKYGDLYDHISDIFRSILIYGTLIYIDYKKFLVMLPLLIILFIGINIQLGCQELYYDKNDSASLSFTKKLCPVQNSNDKELLINVMKYTKYLGTGTFNLYVCLIFLYYWMNKNKK